MTERPVSIHPLELPEAVALLHALTDRVARDHDIRLLVIKGPIATAQGVRPARISADLDVLVDPARVADFREGDGAAGLDEQGHLGERTRDARALGHVHPPVVAVRDRRAPPLSRVLRRPAGRLRGPLGTTYDAPGRAGRRAVPGPDRPGRRRRAALPASPEPRAQPDRPRPTSSGALERLLDGAQRRELAELAAATGAADTLAPVLEPLGAPRPGVGSTSPQALESWRVQTSMAGTHSVTWVSELARSPVRQWPRLLLRAVWLTEADIRVRQPGTGPGRRHLLLARCVRLGEGLRDLPRAVRIVRPWRRRSR